MIAFVLSILWSYGTWCLPPSSPNPIMPYLWEAGDGAHCVGRAPY